MIDDCFVQKTTVNLSNVRACLDRSVAFTERLGLETYDPFDIKSTELAVWSYKKKNHWRKAVRSALYGLELFFPIGIRKFMNIPKKESSGGTARWAQANMALYQLTSEDRFLKRARELLQRLVENPGTSKAGMGWGVPFVWQAYFETVPTNTAVSHTSQSCGNALLDYHDLTGEQWAFEAAEKCADFFVKGLNQTVRPSGAVALSYTHLDTSQVINASAEAAAFLHRCGRPSDQPLVWKVARFLCETQNADGSWYYSAPGSVEGSNPIDSYHTGMNLNGLLVLASNPECLAALESGLKFHMDNHFEEDGCPKMRPDNMYPIDSHSAGESILVLFKAVNDPRIKTTLREQSSIVLDRLVQYTVDNLTYPDGGFVYRRYKGRTMRLDSLRWSQAMLCHGLAGFLLPTKNPLPTVPN